MGRLLHGTSSWSTKGWVGPFYPPGTPPGEFLAYYATRYATVEADTTYYRVPDRRLVDGWDRKLPEGFRLSAKFPRSIVHAGEGPKPDGERVLVPEHVQRDTEGFLDHMGRLGPKCGPLVLQFPYFNKAAFSGPAPFLERLDAYLSALPDTHRYGVEIRNKAWVGEELLEVLRRHRAALVLVDLLYMPHPADLAARYDLFTTDFAYCRLIGDRKAVNAKTKTFDALVLDQSERLDRWAEFLRPVIERIPETYVYANNHYAGHGPATIEELVALIEMGE